MVTRILLALLSVFLVAPVHAQQLFANPLATAEAYRGERADLPEARYRLRYELTRSEKAGEPVVSEVVIDVAADWSLTRGDAGTVLRDFRLNRMFLLDGERFTTLNGAADLTFRVMERQNRTFLNRVLTAAGPQAQAIASDDCDADSELGLAIPGGPVASKAEFREQQGYFAFVCGGREVGGFSASDAPAPPTAFWPTMFSEMAAHPALHRRVRDSGRAPARLETSYRLAPDVVTRRSWRLVAVETVSVAYPLAETMRNATAEALDELVAPGVARLATDVVAGLAQGGAPTAKSWGERLQALSQDKGPAAAAMLLLPTYNMFPELEGACASAQSHPICEFNKGLRAIAQKDPAPLSLLEIAMAEQSNDATAAIAAMQRAQKSPLRDDPVLGASFALALLKFNQDAVKKARDANLPTDIAALQARALVALPYNPAYWTDAGDRYGADYRWREAFLFYDIAFSLPMPSALDNNRALKAKRDLIGRILADFPDASLPR